MSIKKYQTKSGEWRYEARVRVNGQRKCKFCTTIEQAEYWETKFLAMRKGKTEFSNDIMDKFLQRAAI